MPDGLSTFTALGVMAAVALVITLLRGRITGEAPAVQPAVRTAAVATVAQALHFAEETATGLPVRFPVLFGEQTVAMSFFVAINLTFLAIWTLCVWGLGRRLDIALFPLWFLGVAGVGNGLIHPLLALNAGGYFPGLVSSPLMAVLGGVLLRRLARATA